jgi:GTPase SAR1 family protein
MSVTMDESKHRDELRVVVVGPCASGKSTLVNGLRKHGYDAVVCSQEHSEIPTLWRHSDPDFLIMLEVPLKTIRDRRGAEWPESIYRAQINRLAAARKAADVVINSSTADANHVLSTALERIRRRRLGDAAEPGSET